MKLTALMLTVPLTFGSGAVFAQSTTTTDSTVNTPSGKTIEKSSRTDEHPDGSVTSDRSKTVTRPGNSGDSTTVIVR
jgi:hypothetical protein